MCIYIFIYIYTQDAQVKLELRDDDFKAIAEFEKCSPTSACVFHAAAAGVFNCVMMPVLAIIADLVGWFGGAIICSATDSIAIDPPSYFSTMRMFLKFKDVLNGLIKAEIFGLTVVLVCCNIGLNTRGGPREIGAAVTRAVVVSLILILVLDYFVTKLLTWM